MALTQKTAVKPPKGAGLLEIIPLIGFFTAYQLYGLMIATAVLMVLSLIALSIAYFRLRYVSMPLMVGTALIVVFGGLSLLLQDETFIKLRPTLVNTLLGSTLLIGAYRFNRGLLSSMFHMAFELTPKQWRTLSVHYGWFFLTLALLNEIVWRTQPTELWVNYKVFGVMAITFVFTISQVWKFMKRG